MWPVGQKTNKQGLGDEPRSCGVNSWLMFQTLHNVCSCNISLKVAY